MASDLPYYDVFAPQKVPFSKISDDVIACDLWFGPPPPPIKNPGYAYDGNLTSFFLPEFSSLYFEGYLLLLCMLLHWRLTN